MRVRKYKKRKKKLLERKEVRKERKIGMGKKRRK